MHRYVLCFLTVMVLVFGFGFVKSRAYTYTKEEIQDVSRKVVASPVYGEVKKGARLYEGIEDNSRFIEADKRFRAEILRDFSSKWYFVEYEGNKVWVREGDISIPSEGLTAGDSLTDREIECCINTGGFKSKTDRLIWVDIYRQQIYILKGKEESFTLERRMTCATGLNSSPTTRGVFETSDKGEWFYSTRLNSGAKYWVRFNGSYLFHSVAMDKDGNITDPVVGKKRSSGCVRTAVNDAEYIYKTIKKGTTVWVN